MSAINNIEIRAICPSCNKYSTILCQTHIASSFDGENERYCNLTYHIGDKMVWWNKENNNYNTWNIYSELINKSSEAKETCYATCLTCKTNLLVKIHFTDLLIDNFEEINIDKT